MIEASPIALLLVNHEEKIIYLNNFAVQIFSFEKKELTGQKLTKLVPDIYNIKPPDFWESYFARPTTLRLGESNELTATTKSGKKFPIEIRMSPIVTDQTVCTLVTINNIPKLVKANEQIRLVVESAPNAMILTDSSGKISMVNKQTEVLFGYNRDELIGKKIEILVPQRMKKHHPEHRKNFYTHPVARPMGAGRDLYGVKRDGTEIPVEIGLNPVEKDGDQFVLASVIDITERKKNEEAIKLYAKQIEDKNKELEDFTNIASHDLREPLNSIISLTELLMLKKSDNLDEEGMKMLDYISKSSSRMSEMIIGLLEYARLGDSKELVLTDLNELIKIVLLDLDSSVKEANAEIQVEKLPTLHVYAIEMKSLFQNIISNALKYKKKDVSLKISIVAKPVKEGWVFGVSDNGIGIPEAQKEKIFNLFHRLHRKNEYDGTGIGLAHCRKITELHNGKIWVESELGNGSTFYFFIPAKLAQNKKYNYLK